MDDAVQRFEFLKEIFFGIVRANFPGGINPASIIDRKKFARLMVRDGFASSERNFADEMSILTLARATCAPVAGKYYAIDNAAKKSLDAIFANLDAKNVNVIFYDNLFSLHADEFQSFGIASPLILAAFIKKSFVFFFADAYFRLKERPTLREEIKNGLEDKDYISSEDLVNLFPYAPAEEVARIAEERLSFKRLKNGALFAPASVKFDEEEWAGALRQIRASIEEQDFAFTNQINLENSRLLYSHLPDEAFNLTVKERLNGLGFQINKSIIKIFGANLSLPKVITSYCKTLKNFTYEIIEEEFKEVIANISHLPGILQKAAIQIDLNNFANVKDVDFDSYEIDKALFNITNGEPTSLLSFNQFSWLPVINDYQWNSFLLQSYLIHGSKEFNLIQPAFNNNAIGIFYLNKNIQEPNYYKIVADIIQKNNIPLQEEAIKEFILSQGFYAVVRKSTISEILKYINN